MHTFVHLRSRSVTMDLEQLLTVEEMLPVR